MTSRTLLVVCAGLAGLAGRPALAQNGGTPHTAAPAARLESAIAQLAAEDLATRLAADEMLRSPTIRLADLEAAVKKDPTLAGTPEQRQRLLDIGWEHFRSEPRAAMGIRSNWTNGRGVTIDGVTAGYPAANMLKSGDRIETADGVKLEQFNTLRMVILAHDPGDEMALRILRDGAVLNLSVPLGSFADLPERFPDDYSLKQSWTDYRAKRSLAAPRAEAPETLASGVPLPIWARADEQAPDDEAAPTLVQTGNALADDRTSLVVGGQARGGVTPAVLDAGTNARTRRLTPDFQAFQAVRGQADQARLTVQILSEQRRLIDADVQASQRQLADPKIPEERKKGLREDLIQKQSALQVIDNEIRRNQALMNRR